MTLLPLFWARLPTRFRRDKVRVFSSAFTTVRRQLFHYGYATEMFLWGQFHHNDRKLYMHINNTATLFCLWSLTFVSWLTAIVASFHHSGPGTWYAFYVILGDFWSIPDFFPRLARASVTTMPFNYNWCVCQWKVGTSSQRTSCWRIRPLFTDEGSGFNHEQKAICHDSSSRFNVPK